MNEKLQRMGSWQREKRDVDLALFHDMRVRERRNFLYPPKDDLAASLNYDEGLSIFRDLASMPTGKGSDLLTLDNEKNDYNWLLTPPTTPLFPSLDQDAPIVNLSQRRILNRSASVSKTAQLLYPQEPSQKTHGGNPSPCRQRMASSTSSTTSTNRGRPSSPSIARSSPTLRASSPCRPMTPTGRNSAPASKSTSRSSTPTLCRNNTSPSASRAGLTHERSKGKSLSPKLRPWEPSLPGFSAEPPPNLRTSLSDRSIQRGGSQGTRNGVTARTRGSLVAASEVNQPQWHTISPDASGNLSLSSAHDQNSSQTSKGSVVSSYDDDMEIAESVVSGITRTSSDSGSKAAKLATSLEDPSLRRRILPAKRQIRPAGTSGDMMPFVSLAARKSYERQGAQRRSSQTMFRPLLSSAPATSFYTNRSGGIHHRQSRPSVEVSVTMNGSSHLPGNEGGSRDLATEVAVAGLNQECSVDDNDVQAKAVYRDNFSDLGRQETIKEKFRVNLPLGEESKEHMQSGSELRAMKEMFNAFKGSTGVSVSVSKKDGHDTNDQSTQKQKDETAECSKEDTSKHSSVWSQSTPPVEQGCRNLAGNLGQIMDHDSLSFENITCDMDVDTKDLNTSNQGHHGEQHAHKQHNFPVSCGNQIPTLSPLMQQFKECEHHVEDNKMVTAVKPHSYSGLVGSISSQHGAQRLLTDSGSFRKQSSTKNLNMRFQDGMMSIDKSTSCDLSTSDSHGFNGSSVSFLGDGWSTGAPDECLIDEVQPAFYCDSSDIMNKVLPVEKPGMCSERDFMERGALLHTMHVENISDVMGSNVKSESFAATAHHIQSVAVNQNGLLEDNAELGNSVCATPEGLMHEVFSVELKARLSVDSNDKLAQQDVLSIIGSCALELVSVEQDVAQHCCAEPDITTHPGRNIDAMHLCSKLASECREEGENSAANELVVYTECGDDLSKSQQQDVPLLKRNVTLEEATDTILFCSSIVHELVYKAATLAIQDEEQKSVKASGSRREFVTLFGFYGAEHKTSGGGKTPTTRNRKRQPPSSSVVHKTSSYVQKQRMVHRQTPAVTMRQSPMERIENAVMGNLEEIQTPTVMAKLQKKTSKQAKRVQCRCSCCMM